MGIVLKDGLLVVDEVENVNKVKLLTGHRLGAQK